MVKGAGDKRDRQLTASLNDSCQHFFFFFFFFFLDFVSMILIILKIFLKKNKKERKKINKRKLLELILMLCFELEDRFSLMTQV